MLIAGLDLAAEPKGTALAVLEWSQNRVNLLSLQVGVDDETVVAAAANFAKLGIDCALGWPSEFANFVKAYSSASLEGQAFDGGIDWRRKLAYRETDREVHRLTGRWPLFRRNRIRSTHDHKESSSHGCFRLRQKHGGSALGR